MLNDFFEFEGFSDAYEGLEQLAKRIRLNRMSEEKYVPFDPIKVNYLIGPYYKHDYNKAFVHIYKVNSILGYYGVVKSSIQISSEYSSDRIIVQDSSFTDDYFLEMKIENDGFNLNFAEYSSPYKSSIGLVNSDLPCPESKVWTHFGAHHILVYHLEKKVGEAEKLDVKKNFQNLLEDELKAVVIHIDKYRQDEKRFRSVTLENDREIDPMDNYNSNDAWDDAFGDAPDSAIGRW